MVTLGANTLNVHDHIREWENSVSFIMQEVNKAVFVAVLAAVALGRLVQHLGSD